MTRGTDYDRSIHSNPDAAAGVGDGSQGADPMNDTTAAIARLAALFPYGALEADTMPAVFLGHVADEIEALRAKVDHAARVANDVRVDALLDAIDAVSEDDDRRRFKRRMIVAEHMRFAVLAYREVLRLEWETEAKEPPTPPTHDKDRAP